MAGRIDMAARRYHGPAGAGIGVSSRPMTFHRRRALALPLLVAAGWMFWLGTRGTAHADPLVATAAPAVEVAIVSTPALGEQSTVAWASVGAPPKTVAVLDHPRDASVRGVVLPGTRAIAVALDASDARDRSFASALVVVEEGSAPRRLVAGVAHAALPIATDDGKLLIERGAAGPVAHDADGKLRQRVDDLEVTEVDPATSAARPLFTGAGYTAHVVGALGREALFYRVTPAAAELVAVHRGTRALRVVADVGPLARDFVVDRTTGSVVFSFRRRSGPSTLARVDVASGATTELASFRRDPVPFALPTGGVMFTPDGGVRTHALGAAPTVAVPAGAFFWGKAATSTWVAGLLVPDGALPVPVVVAADGTTHTLAAPADQRVDVVGFGAKVSP